MRNLPVVHGGLGRGLAATAVDGTDAEHIASMFKALGDPVRLRLTALIAAQDEICVCNLTPHFSQSGPTISHHLKVLPGSRADRWRTSRHLDLLLD